MFVQRDVANGCLPLLSKEHLLSSSSIFSEMSTESTKAFIDRAIDPSSVTRWRHLDTLEKASHPIIIVVE